jgi:hypothetical protein
VPNRLHRSWPLRRVLRQRLVGRPAPADTAWTHARMGTRSTHAGPLPSGGSTARRVRPLLSRWRVGAAPRAGAADGRARQAHGAEVRAGARRRGARLPRRRAPLRRILPWCARCCEPSRLGRSACVLAAFAAHRSGGWSVS